MKVLDFRFFIILYFPSSVTDTAIYELLAAQSDSIKGPTQEHLDVSRLLFVFFLVSIFQFTILILKWLINFLRATEYFQRNYFKK